MTSVPSNEVLRSLERQFPELRLIADCWIAGGAIRDVLLGRAAVDLDTVHRDAEGEARRFSRYTGARLIELGKERFITWRVVVDQQRVYDFTEMTGGSMEIDLARRDFTVNAIAINRSGSIVLDPFDGAADIEARLIRAVCARNLTEDPLRMLKAIRMAAVLRFGVEEATIAAIRENAAMIGDVATERVNYELFTALAANPARTADLLERTRLGKELFGSDVAGSTIAQAIPAGDAILALAALVPGAESEKIAERWRWDKATSRGVEAAHNAVERFRASTSDDSLAIAIFDAGEDATRRAIALLSARSDHAGSRAARVLSVRRGIFDTKPFLNGEEIERVTTARGRELGAVIRDLLEAQIRREVTNRREAVAFVTRAR